jgi:hypothetical protein
MHDAFDINDGTAACLALIRQSTWKQYTCSSHYLRLACGTGAHRMLTTFEPTRRIVLRLLAGAAAHARQSGP